MEPLISLTIKDSGSEFHPGEELNCEFQVDAVGTNEVQAVEASVLWFTEGKGDEDLGVHYFERRLPADVEGGDLRQLQHLRTILPNSPLSYDGAIVRIQWCARVRVFLRGGREIFFEQPFKLGAVPAVDLESITAEPPAARPDARPITSAGENSKGDTSADDTSSDDNLADDNLADDALKRHQTGEREHHGASPRKDLNGEDATSTA